MNEPKKYHAISRFYLEDFAKNGTLYVYDLEKKEIRLASAESICNENNFYVGQIEGQDIESKLAKNESKVAPLMKELISKRDFSLLCDENRKNFALFVSLMHVRGLCCKDCVGLEIFRNIPHLSGINTQLFVHKTHFSYNALSI